MTRIAIITAGLLALACNGSPGLTAEEQANIDTLQARIASYNAQAEGWADDFLAGLADDFVYRAYVPWAPDRMTADRQQLIEMMKGAAKAFPDRRTTIHNLIASGDTVISESEWSGTASDQNPRLKAGERQVVRGVLFERFRDGKIIEMREYAIVVPAS
jgi:ketosteroid isomerase-like protein